MYYRIAIQANTPPIWRWRSAVLGSLPIVLRWLLYTHCFPREHLFVFSAASREELDDELRRANAGLAFTSVPATQFVPVGSTSLQPHASEALESFITTGATRDQEMPTATESVRQPLLASPLEQSRDALERGSGGDHNLPYQYSAPNWTPEVLAWAKLLARVELGDLHAEVVAIA